MNYVYYFTDYNDTIIYVGRTSNIKKRIKQHFEKGHLPKECYNSINKIFYSKVNDSKYDTEICETLLINKYKPKYNVEKKFNENENKTSFSLLDLSFEEIFYNFENKETQFQKPIPNCYISSLNKDKCDLLLEYNINILHNKQGCFEHYLNLNNDNIECITHVYNHLKKHIDYENSNLDEPISENGDLNTTYIAFNITTIDSLVLKISDVLMLYKYGFIFEISDYTYGIPLLTEAVIKNMSLKKDLNF